ncbi:MAG TPA: flagellar protein FlgN [Legionella sp.]|nr:flagellar protein FlgN [Legionella sp.]
MNNNNNANILLTHLKQEIDWLIQLNDLLSEEKTALNTSEFNNLQTLALKKEELSAKLENSAAQRMELINNQNSNSLKEFLAKCKPEEAKEITEHNSKLMEQLSICRELNTVNGQVIASNLHTRQQIVSALSGKKDDALNIYTSNGNIKSGKNDKSHHQEA